MVLERTPVPSAPSFEADAAEDEGPVSVVLELVLRVDPPGDPDVGPATLGGDRVGLGDGHHRGAGEEPADPVGGAERAQDQPARDEGDEPRGREEEGSHGRMIAAGMERPEGTYSRRGR